MPISYTAAFAASAFLGVVEQWLTAQEIDGQTAATYFRFKENKLVYYFSPFVWN